MDRACGLSAAEAALRLKRYGPNRLTQRPARTSLQIFADQFRSLIVWLLVAAVALSIYLGDHTEAVAIFAVLALNTAIGFVTELRALRSMEALRRIAQIKTRVLRERRTVEIDARDLAPGDLVVLDAGDVVTADLRLVEVSNLQSDESALTGESAPIAKHVEPMPADTPLADRANMAFKGAAVTVGGGLGVVVATGMATELGRISRLVEAAEPQATPLERRLDRLGRRLLWLTLGLTALIVALGVLRGQDLTAMIETAIALAVAAIPEGLPVVATLCLARGMWRMAERNALISKLSAVETLGATTVILTDKTGTLTENRMTVAALLLDGEDVSVAAAATRGPGFTAIGGSVDPAGDPRLAAALETATLCNNSALAPPSESAGHPADGVGDPMELALLAVARKGGVEREALVGHRPRRREHAFDPIEKMMSTVHDADGGALFAVKGAPEHVIERCDAVLGADGARPLHPEDRAGWAARAREAAGRGYRMLALARKTGSADDAPYEGLTLIGFLCLLDPLRADVPPAIAACQAAGVKVVMLTGDHAHTAAEIARQAGIGGHAPVAVEGRDLGDLAEIDAATRARILSADVFARVTPEAKLRIAGVFQDAGEIVAMTGDGVNDAPALKKAEIGIAMGQRGTQVAREAAHMVLRDDAFPSVVAAMREGRIVFDNIRKFVVFLLSCNLSEVLVVGLAVGMGMPLPLLPLQILYLNLVTDVFPAFALGLGGGDPGIMSRPPRDPSEPIVNRRAWTLIGSVGAVITLCVLTAFAAALYWLETPVGEAVTIAFLSLALAQIWNVFNLRDRGADPVYNEVTRNPYVWAATLVALVLTGLAVWLPPLSQVLSLPAPGADGLLLALCASLAPLILAQIGLLMEARGWFAPTGRFAATS